MEKQTQNNPGTTVNFEALDKVLDGLIEIEATAVQHNNEAIQRKTHKETEDNKVREAKIEEYRQAKEALHKIVSK